MGKLLITLFISLIGFSSYSQTVGANYQSFDQDFMIDSRLDFGGRVYYNCLDVESKVEFLLEKLGARDISVRCFGGLDNFRPIYADAASVRLQYSALKSSDMTGTHLKAQWTPLKIRSGNDCHLLRQVFNQVRGNFEIRNVTGPSSCGSTFNQDFKLQLEVIQPL
jgi:hypothetical protein